MIVFCSKCKTMFDSNEADCPKCGSTDRTAEVSDSFAMYESHIGVESKHLYSGKHKFFCEIADKPSFDRDTQQAVMVTRKYNRLKESSSPEETYIEEIRAKDGTLIKRNTDKLSEHKGHGSDKKNKRPEKSIGGDSHA